MVKKEDISFQTKGTSVNSRILPALDPNFFGIDERSLADLMNFTLGFSEKVDFINLENKKEGKWNLFFDRNLAFLIALITGLEIDKIDDQFRKVLTEIEDDKILTDQTESLRHLINHAHLQFLRINHWYKIAKDDLIYLEENKLFKELKRAIVFKLASQYKAFLSLVNELNQEYFKSEILILDTSAFDLRWGLDKWKPEVVGKEKRPFDVLVKEVSENFKIVFGVIAYIQNKSGDLLTHTLEEYPYHSPHISLYLSFLKLFKEVQNDVNKITEKHLDFYYSEILEQQQKESEPDRVHLYLEPADHIQKSHIEAGTSLLAGVDDEGIDYIYKTDIELELSQANITDLKVMHVAENPLVGIGESYKRVSNIYAADIALSEGGFPLDKYQNEGSFDTFGMDQLSISKDKRTMNQARIGWAISSPILLLKEGDRKITIQYGLDVSSLSSLVSFIEEMSEAEGLSAENSFYKLLNKVLKLRFTTPTGWFETDDYEVLPPKSWLEGELTVTIDLKISDPEIACYDVELHEGEYNTEWPIAEFVLSSDRAMYAYSYFKDLKIEEFAIDVEVKNVKNLYVFNDLGELDINKPFYPFGTTANLGSYLLIGNEEIFKKNLTRLDFNIHWHNLPRLVGGFTDYYKEYNAGIKNESFKMGVTGLSDYRFLPLDEGKVEHVPLFEFDTDTNKLKDKSVLSNIALDKLKLNPDYSEIDYSGYSSSDRTGFIKLELSGPEIAFGHNEYPQLFSQAVIENSKKSFNILPGKEPKSIPLPNTPYNPQIRSFSLDYSASTKISFDSLKAVDNDKRSKDKIFHLYPFGTKEVYANSKPISNRLIPEFNNEGNLFIGLEDLRAPLEISFYFELVDNVSNEINQANIPETKWMFLHNDDWVEFQKSEVLIDTTNHFTTTGIVRLKIPEIINNEHTILPSGKFWIAVCVEDSTEILSKTLFVKTNGVSATWVSHKPNAMWNRHIPEDTIISFAETRSDVKSINQPVPSFGGKLRETVSDYYVRVSERLKHKNRAVTPDDFEKIILQQFPSLHQVRCLNKLSHSNFLKNGVLKLIVVPKIVDTSQFIEPKVDYNQLHEIQQFIETKVTSFAKVEVLNPVYEKVKISCIVRFEGGVNNGGYVKDLESDLGKFISPWFGVDQGEMNFGGSIEKDDIQTYIEGLPYVEFLTKLSVVVLHYKDGEFSLSDSAENEGEVNKLVASTPWSVLVADVNHNIEMIERYVYDTPLETKIETMKIGADFVIIEEDRLDDFPQFNLEEDTYYTVEIDI